VRPPEDAVIVAFLWLSGLSGVIRHNEVAHISPAVP